MSVNQHKQLSYISKYIHDVEEKIREIPVNYTVVLYRGESRIYATPCQPNIFRRDEFTEDKYFELNLFAEMAANCLTTGQTHLEMAVDAQHGGFPSRLLDVTYNCLTALYFAVTPFYTQAEDSQDNEDGIVYLFFMEKGYCPTGKNITEAYDACICHDVDWFNGQDLFQKNHKLIDHIKKNPRIIAQQGAFILFQGDNLSSFPQFRYTGIRIPKEEKKRLREELKQLFGIHTGSIYPEGSNLVNEMVNRSKTVSSDSFSIENEVELVFNNLRDMIRYYTEKLTGTEPKKYLKIINEAEKDLLDYCIRTKRFLKNLEHDDERKNLALDVQTRFNNLICEFADDADRIMCADKRYQVEISRDELLVNVVASTK